MRITCSAFLVHQAIPRQYTCDGDGINPPLEFHEIPEEAKSLVLLMDDPDVPKNLKPDGNFDHWVIYNMDPFVREILENSKPSGIEGLNSAKRIGYTPPCPPDREHRYFFKLYALDTQLHFLVSAQVTKQMIIDTMKDHILAEAELVGTYNRQSNK